MAINPNTDFTAYTPLSAAQQNRFPRGVMSYVQSTSNATVTTSEVITLTAPSFTAVANRYYRITYYEPAAQTPAGAGNYVLSKIRRTNLAGTQLQGGQLQNSGATQVGNTLVTTIVTTFSAGSVVLVASGLSSSGSVTWFRGSDFPAFLVVEDIGPA